MLVARLIEISGTLDLESCVLSLTLLSITVFKELVSEDWIPEVEQSAF